MREKILDYLIEKRGIVVYNPVSGCHQAKKELERLKPMLEKREVEYSEYETLENNPLAQARDRVSEENPEFIIIVAGDGTANAWANAILKLNPECTLLIRPAGSGNDLTYSLPDNGEITKIDVGYLEEEDRYYLNTLDVGFGGKVAARANKTLRRLRSRSFLPPKYIPHFAYFKAAFFSAFSYKAQKYTITLDKKSPIASKKKYLMIGMLNGKREGKVFTAAPDASLRDSLLNVNLIEDVPAIKRFHCLLKARNGKQRFLDYVTYKTTSKIYIKSDEKFPIQTDGEKLEPKDELTISVKPKKLKIAKI